MDKRIQLVVGAAAAVLVILGFLLFSGAISPVVPVQVFEPEDVFANVQFTPIVAGCAETDNGTDTRGQFSEEKPPALFVEGRTLFFNNVISHACCRKAEVTSEFIPPSKEGPVTNINIEEYMNQIIIRIKWSGESCRCICGSELGAEIAGLSNGKYIVTVVQEGVNPDGTEMEEAVLLSEEVTVPVQIPETGPWLENFVSCEQDSDCVKVDETCCFCGDGGKRVAINADSLNEYNLALLEKCASSPESCIPNSGDDKSCRGYAFPVCRARVCIIEFFSGEPKPVYYTGEQCKNPVWRGIVPSNSDEQEIQLFYSGEREIEIPSVEKVCPDIAVCAACGCPNACYFKAMVPEGDLAQMLEDGWVQSQPVE